MKGGGSATGPGHRVTVLSRVPPLSSAWICNLSSKEVFVI